MRVVSDGRRANRHTDGRCAKRPFKTKAKAMKDLRGRFNARQKTKHAYFCRECRAWHLSSRR